MFLYISFVLEELRNDTLLTVVIDNRILELYVTER
jgi:hypothetical protein